MTTLLATVLRGLRARVLLSAGSVLLTALAIGSAVLGPVFQQAVTNSYLITRLNDAPNELTGLTWRFHPDGQPSPRAAADLATRAAARQTDGPFLPAQASVESRRIDALGGAKVELLARADSCAHLAIAGRCPTHPGEILMLTGDLDRTGLSIGDTIGTGSPGGGGYGTVTLVGTYRIPSEQSDFWFQPERFASIPPVATPAGVQPYKPAPFITPAATFNRAPASSWSVLVDRRLQLPPDFAIEDLPTVERAVAALRDGQTPVSGGTFVGESINDVKHLAIEVRAQQRTAKASVTPAVISLVLVAMALLLRLLTAAAELRLPELALASLRGLPRRRMWALGLSEPLTLLALSIPIGAAAGLGLAWSLVRWWLVPGLPLPLPWIALGSGAVVAIAAVAVAVAAAGLVLRVSLSDQLTGVRRPQRTSRLGLVAQLALMAAAVVILVSKLSAGRPGRPDITDLVLPVLLAIVAGLAATRLVAGAARHWTRARNRTRSLAGFVAARAISRRHEGTLVILPVTAAIAICVFGAGVYQSAGQWRESVAATAAPADEVWSSSMSIDQTVGLTHRLDPDGRWLMAAGLLNSLGPTYTVVDAPRLARVVAWQDLWTPGTSASDVGGMLALRADVPIVTGSRVGITVDNQIRSDSDLVVRLRLNALGDRTHDLFLGPFAHGESSVSRRAPYCEHGCLLQGMTIGGPASLPTPMEGTLTVGGIEADGKPVPGAVRGAGWTRSPRDQAAGAVRAVSTRGGRIVIGVDSGGRPAIGQLSSGDVPAALPVVAGVDSPTTAQSGSYTATSDLEFPVHVALKSQSVPFLGPSGLLIDYGTVSVTRELYDQGQDTWVLARADTPERVLRGLEDAGVTRTNTLAAEKHTLDQGAYALALRLYAVVAGLVLLMALAGLVVSTAVQLPSRRRDAAALRVVGVPRRSVMASVVCELVVVLGGTAVAGLAAGTLAQYVVLRTVTLGYVDNIETPALVAAIDWQRLIGLAVLAVLTLGAVALASAGLTVRGARGSTLRENAR